MHQKKTKKQNIFKPEKFFNMPIVVDYEYVGPIGPQ